MDSTTSNSENTFSTSMNTSSLSHPYYDDDAIPINSPVKADTNKRINIISNIIIKKSSTKRNKENISSSSSITIVNNSPDKNVSLSTSNVNENNVPVDVDTDLNAVIPSMYIVSDPEPNTIAPVIVYTDHNVTTPLTYYVDAVDPDLSTPANLDTHLDTSLYNVDAASSGLSPTVDINTDLSSINKTDPVLPLDAHNVLNAASTSGYNAAADPVSPSADIQSKLYTDNSSIKNANAASPCLPAKKRPVRAMHKNILDFLSDDDTGDYSAGSSDDWAQENTSESSDEDTSKTKKKKLKKFKKQETDLIKRKKILKVNKRKLGKIKKEKGKEYETEKGKVVHEKKMQSNPCNPDKCKRGCYNITEERRATLFNFYWNLDSQRRKDWLVRSSHVVPCARKRTDSIISRRTLTYEYYVNNGDDHQKVCQKFLISTLDITQKFLLYTLNTSANDVAQEDRRQRNTSNKYSDFAKTQVKQFIEKLPAVPSHYNRKRTNRVYLPQELKNVSNLYRLYLKECQSSNIEFVSESLFRSIFQNEYNLSFHVPKKDKCILCVKAENNKDLSESDQNSLQEHLKEKQATYKRFEQHQRLPSLKSDTIVCTFDLQKVLNTPYGDSVVLYYSRKYPLFNFTLYESVTQEVFCYLWGECDAKRGANEIATCLYSYLKSVDERGIKNILFYCDSCPGQNKNKTILSVLNYFLMKSTHLEVIQINYLLPGHTYMPVDSVHATIEREVKKIIVWSPTQWPSYIEAARKNPRPYNVNVMEYSDFLNWNEITAETFTNETSKTLKMRNIRIITLKKKNPNEMYIKYSMKEETSPDKVILFKKSGNKEKGQGRGKGRSKSRAILPDQGVSNDTHEKVMTMSPTALYKNKLPISDVKYRDLKRLCDNGIIPKRYHHDYFNLPHGNVADSLTLTDEEDEEELIE
jgi:hypothetical protein